MNSRTDVYRRSAATVLAVLTWVCPFLTGQACAQDTFGGRETPVAKPPEAVTAPPEATTQPAAGAESKGADKETAPAWTADARWYEVVIPKFHNGDPSNDRSGTLSWSTEWPVFDGPAVRPREEPARSEWFTAASTLCLGRLYGGDLQGVRERLPYFEELGVNTLYLGPVFHQTVEGTTGPVDLRHVDDSLGVKNSLAEVTGEEADPKTWQFTASDRVFLDFLKQAHGKGLRVVIQGRFGPAGTFDDPLAGDDGYLLAVTRRWMDPNGDGDSADGIDGWMVDSGSRRPEAFWKRWAAEVRRVKPQAVVVWHLPDSPTAPASGPFDVRIDFAASEFVQEFIRSTGDEGDRARPATLFDTLTSGESSAPAAVSVGNLISWRSIMGPRLLSSLDRGRRAGGEAESSSASSTPPAEAYARWRLATILQHFWSGAPVTFYGDEVGMFGGPTVVNAERPMWWNDLPDPKTKSPQYRGDFFALVQWLHQLRERYAPLRRGGFRSLLLEKERRVLSLARSLPGDDVVLVMNYGSEKQLVNLPAGRPGQLVAVLSPQLDPAAARSGSRQGPAKQDITKRTRLQVGGSRQFVNDEGRVRVWVNPMSVRVILVSDKEPR